MLVFKNKKILWEVNGDNVPVLCNTTVERYDQLKAELHRQYGTEYGLSEVKQAIITLK